MVSSLHDSSMHTSQFEQAFYSLPVAVITTDRLGTVTLANERACSLLRLQMEAIVGQPLDETLGIWDPQQARVLALPLQKVLDEGMQMPPQEMTVRHSIDGISRTLSIAMGPISDESGRSTGVVVTFAEVQPGAASQVMEALHSPAREAAVGPQALYVRSNGRYVRVLLEELLSVEAMENYVQLQTVNEKFIVHATLKSMVDALEGKGYQRIHRSFIVRRSEIERIEENHVYVHGKLLPIGKSYRADLLKCLTLI